MELPRSGESLERAYAIAREYLPYDAVVTGQPTPALQHVRSRQFAAVMPDELLGERAAPGDLFVRYNIAGERVASITFGSGHPSG